MPVLQMSVLLLSCELVLMLLLAAGLTQEVTTIAQESASAALTAVTLLLAPAQGTGAASLPQETSGEDTQMLSAPGATQMLTAAGTSTVRTSGVEGRVQTLQVLSHKGTVVHNTNFGACTLKSSHSIQSQISFFTCLLALGLLLLYAHADQSC